jgi:hypothetical protein
MSAHIPEVKKSILRPCPQENPSLSHAAVERVMCGGIKKEALKSCLSSWLSEE